MLVNSCSEIAFKKYRPLDPLVPHLLDVVNESSSRVFRIHFIIESLIGLCSTLPNLAPTLNL